MRAVRCVLCVLAGSVAVGALAARAPWYEWQSLANGQEACAQTSPGKAWRRVGGPFIDSACRRPLRIVPL